MIGGSIGTVAAASALWLVLTLAALIRAMGGSVPHSLEVVCAAVAAPAALAAAAHAISAFWRGPTILSFSRVDSEVCSPDEAAYVRLVAQLRGTMGGAGFLHPARIVLPVVAWIAAAAEGAALAASGLDETVFAALALVGIGATSAAILFPPRAYFYQEATGGTAILSPPSAARRMKVRAARAQALSTGRPVESPAPSPAPLPSEALAASGAGPPDARA